MGKDRSRGQAPQSILTNEASAAHQRGAFFGRRKGHKLRKQQAELYEELLPDLSLDLTQPCPRDLAALFSFRPEKFQLEIGFGGGEHLLHEARRNPQTGFIGCEPFINGMAKMLAVISGEAIANIRLHPADALYLLDWLPETSLDRIDILYADPWPKKRHWKRRFISDANVARFARVLKPSGILRFASDIDTYVEWTLVRVLRNPDFFWLAEKADGWRLAWDGWPGTRYEQKAIREGRTPAYLEFRRN
ncbi:MAG TPA: tRNA (guanine(46)-N(7))-methyltransferase TrmB [Xanthobacteraceae bacterium]|nr:tRNA (guanine(46)-N(7))-methyltransferase TrmB [Xanthobacteraceae bacterium]